ncbi:unnamed protein product [Boreogadus saida]
MFPKATRIGCVLTLLLLEQTTVPQIWSLAPGPMERNLIRGLNMVGQQKATAPQLRLTPNVEKTDLPHHSPLCHSTGPLPQHEPSATTQAPYHNTSPLPQHRPLCHNTGPLPHHRPLCHTTGPSFALIG